MLRIHLTAEDFARVRLAPRPAPLQELNVALRLMCRSDGDLRYTAWRHRALRALPAAAGPLADLVPGGIAPGFLDVTADSLPQALDRIRSSPPAFVGAELERVYGSARTPVPSWVVELHCGEAGAWELLRRAQQAAFDALLRPVWGPLQELHHGEFVRRAVELATGGAELLLSGLVPGARMSGGVWELPGRPRELRLGGRGLMLLPSFHGAGAPLLSEPPDGPLVVTYPAGTGLLPQPDGATGSLALARVLGTTRAELLGLLAAESTTGALARRLRVSAATVSAHTAALRGAGLITTTRAGKAVLHRRTALGSLLLREHS